LADWKESPLFERDDKVKVTRVDAEFNYEGELEGSAFLGYLMFYAADGTGTYSGWERFTGTFHGLPGEVILAHQGSFDAQAVRAKVSAVPGTGTGSLTGIGLGYEVRFEGHGPYPLTLEVE